MTADAAHAAAALIVNLMMASLLIRFVLPILHETLRTQFQIVGWTAPRASACRNRNNEALPALIQAYLPTSEAYERRSNAY
jgi:hypothetical protein